MRDYRVAKARHAHNAQTMLSGEGAREWGGRFNSPGVRAVYCASTLSLAALEILVHAPRVAILPEYRFLEIQVPDRVIEHIADEDIAEDTTVLGDERLGADGIFGFSVASFVMPQERNVVLNPDHPDFATLVTHGEVKPFMLDERLLLR
ncbi:MAG: RES family NAD+ phosphorylase [Gammaproteobacteria bacterium]|nr:RES family NAD+ phosphorylase [Gammaproteobacteria bacterium]